MRVLTILALGLLSISMGSGEVPANIICRYNSNSFQRPGLGKMNIADLDLALSMCTHLLYGHAGVREDNHKIASLYPLVDLDFDGSSGHYRLVTNLKQRFPSLKVILSVGGNADQVGKNSKYLTLLETSAARLAFINSAHSLVKTYGFDGIDLAWQLPTKAPVKKRSSLGNIWSNVKSFVSSSGNSAEKQQEQRNGLSLLLEEMKRTFERDRLAVLFTINPDVNTQIYVDTDRVYAAADLITLPTYDLWSPIQTPNEANHPAAPDTVSEVFANMSLSDAQAAKTIIAIPTYGRTWTLDLTSDGVPPIANARIGLAGPLTERPGLLSYPEICQRVSHLVNSDELGANASLHMSTVGYATYAWRSPDVDGQHGIWVGFEHVSSIDKKVDFVKKSHLSGIAIVDLDLDDFRGTCTGEKYPLLRAAKRGF